MKYEDYVVQSILCNNNYEIKVVNELISIEDLVFDFDKYSEVKPLIEVGDFASIKLFSNNKEEPGLNDGLRQYLGIMSFSDQNKKKYIVTVYDSDALEQDPQVIDILPQTPA